MVTWLVAFILLYIGLFLFKRIIKKINLTEMEIGDILDELENKGQQPA